MIDSLHFREIQWFVSLFPLYVFLNRFELNTCKYTFTLSLPNSSCLWRSTISPSSASCWRASAVSFLLNNTQRRKITFTIFFEFNLIYLHIIFNRFLSSIWESCQNFLSFLLILSFLISWTCSNYLCIISFNLLI